MAVALHCQRDDLAGAALRLGGMRAVLFIHDGVQPVQLGAAGVGHLVGDHDGIGMDALDVGEVDALHYALDTVEHGVE